MEQMVTLKTYFYQVLSSEGISRISQGTMIMIRSFIALFSIYLDNSFRLCSYNDRYLSDPKVVQVKYWNGHVHECDILSP